MAIKPIPNTHKALKDAPAQHGAGLFVPGLNLMTPSTSPVTTLLLVESRMYLTPIYIAQRVGLFGWAFEVTTIGTAGAIVRGGLYANDPASGNPTGPPIFDRTQASTSLGLWVPGIPSFPGVGPGVFWIAAVGQGAPATQATLRAIGGFLPWAETTVRFPNEFDGMGKLSNGVTGALPTLSGAILTSGTVAPRLALQTDDPP